MRGDGLEPQPHMWSYIPLEQRIPAEHPLRPLRAMVDVVSNPGSDHRSDTANDNLKRARPGRHTHAAA